MHRIKEIISQVKQYKCTYTSKQYQEWKQYNYWIQTDFTLRLYLLISFLFILIKITLIGNNYLDWIGLGIVLIIHILLFIILNRSWNVETFILEIIAFIIQLSIYWLCYVVQYYENESYIFVVISITITYQTLYKGIIFKILSLISFFIYSFFLINSDSLEGIFICIGLIITQSIRLEITKIQQFLNLRALFLIIESIPQAMCIVNKSKNWLLYSNKYFENLAIKLESINCCESESPTTKLSQTTFNLSKTQLNFLQNLQLEQLNIQGQSLIEFEGDDLQNEEQYKILDVQYNKNQPIISTAINQFDNNSPTKQRQRQQQFFSSFKLSDEEQINRKTYISDVTMKVELNHQQQQQSSLREKYRKISANQIKLSQTSNFVSPSRKLSVDHLLQSRERDNNKEKRFSGARQSLIDQDFSAVKSKPSVITYDMKFLVQKMENCKIIESNQDELEIYFIHELNQIILKSQLKKSEQVKKNILRTISHELLTNLNAVHGYLTQCQNKIDKQLICSNEINLALSYTKLQQYKILDFFDYRDILEDKLILKKEKFQINQIIWECVNLLKDQIERKNLTINVDLPEISYSIFGDRQRLIQVLLNLIGNAIRFTYKGGISVIVQKKRYDESMQGISDDADLQLNSQFDQFNLIEIIINDTGIGMNEDQLSTLRKKLHVSDEDEKISKQSVGVGLGLQVCKAIIKSMAPTSQNILCVDSKQDDGSQFYFTLQYLQNIEESNNQLEQQLQQQDIPQYDSTSTQLIKVINYKKSINQQTLSKQPFSILTDNLTVQLCNCNTILIVDDEPFNIDVLSNLIQSQHFQIQTATNGKIAVDKVINKLKNGCCINCVAYRAILMDINMPVMGGWEAVQRIRILENKYKLTRKIPIIAVTAFCSKEDQQKSISEGFNCVLIKPVNKESILNLFYELNI